MTAAPSITLVTLAALAIACGPQRIAGPSRPVHETIVLLADSESGLVGSANVSNPSGAIHLAAAHDATEITANKPPSPPHTLSDAEVSRMFGGALSALPAAPRHFTLYFKFESDELTDESHALLPNILGTVKEHSVPDVTVVGHTDSRGASAANFALGLKRAMTVRDLLMKAGLDVAVIDVTSHGERTLLIQTSDETSEPRNRRVEISVR